MSVSCSALTLIYKCLSLSICTLKWTFCMLPSEHPAIDYIPFPDPLEIETPIHRERTARQEGLCGDTDCGFLPHSEAYQRFQIGVSGKCLISPYCLCLRLIDINPRWALAYPKLRQKIYAERDGRTDRGTEADPFNAFTQEF